MGVGLGQGRARQPTGAAGEGAEERPLAVVLDVGAVETGVQLRLGVVMAGHLVALAAFLVPADPRDEPAQHDWR